MDVSVLDKCMEACMHVYESWAQDPRCALLYFCVLCFSMFHVSVLAVHACVQECKSVQQLSVLTM